MGMTIHQLCETCEALRRDLHAAGKKMDGQELSAYRKSLMVRYNAGFLNGWTVRMCKHVSDVFHARQQQMLTHRKKGLFGKTTTHCTTKLTLTAPMLADTVLTCTVRTNAPLGIPEAGARVRVSGELEAVLFLGGDAPEWRSGEFTKAPKVTLLDEPIS